jgi:FKBP-type peptidyl-prolyl cis-trans isomerase FkpA
LLKLTKFILFLEETMSKIKTLIHLSIIAVALVLLPQSAFSYKEHASSMDAEFQKIDREVGTGEEAIVGSTVNVHYTGWIFDASAEDYKGRKFDSSRDRDSVFSFLLGSGRVIKGWDQGVMGMKVGGHRTLIIPPYMAYGSQGAGNIIPPNAKLVFDVELVGIQEGSHY